MTEHPFVTGWCNDQPGHPPALHHLCRHVYSSQTGKTNVCTCSCHTPERTVKRTLKPRGDSNGS